MNNGSKSKTKKKFVRYKEGAEIYSLGVSSFIRLAREANAVYKINKLVLVNCEILDQYLELYHIV